MKGEQLKTLSFDVRNEVFENEHEGIMYITKDIYLDCYNISIPVITFSYDITSDIDYKKLEAVNVFGDKIKQQKLIKTIKKAISEYDHVFYGVAE